MGIVFAIASGDIDNLWYVMRLIPGLICVLLAWMTREQIGFGDAFLIFIMGLYCNVAELVNVCLITFSLAGMVSLVLLAVAKKSKKYEMPLIPFMFLSRIIWLCCT